MIALQTRLRAQLAEKHEAGLLRTRRQVPAGALDLASNDYLGFSGHPRVIESAARAMAAHGAGARASPLLSGYSALHAELTRALAAFKGCEAALLFSSGYAANLAVLTALAGRGDVILCDKRNHASLIDACRLAGAGGARVRYYASTARARELLQREAGITEATAQIFVVSDAVFSMDGDLCDAAGLAKLCIRYNAALILDDAHGTGTLGATGRGTLQHLAQLGGGAEVALLMGADALIQVGTLSKALGSQGGFVCGPQWLIDGLVNSARPFIYSTGLNPGSCGAALCALNLIDALPQRLAQLHAVRNRLALGLADLGYRVLCNESPVMPLLVGDAGPAVALSEALRERGVWCPAIRPPTVPVGQSRLRLTANAGFADDDIERVLAAFAACRPLMNL